MLFRSSPGVRARISCSYDALADMILCPSSPVAHNLGSETKKATGTPMYMAIGQCGSILGSHIYPKTEGPRYMCVSRHALTCSPLFLHADSDCHPAKDLR